MDERQIFKTTKGKPSAILHGYQYRQHRVNKEEIVTWLCVKEKLEKCHGTQKTKEGHVLSISDHDCKPNVAEIEVKIHKENAKKRARDTDQDVSKIYREEMGMLFDRGYEFICEVPMFSSLKSNLYRHRQIAKGISSEPKSAAEIEIPDRVLQMKDGSSFLLADDGHEDRILMFSSVIGRDIMSKHESFFMNGTFKCCSKQFTQLYTIHADIGSRPEETNIVPAVFVLLKNKTRVTYERVFTVLKNNIAWNPTSVTLDFEQAAITALRSVFPNVTVQGCNFHFNQCIWRKVQELGLVQEYRDNQDIRLHIRMCAALAYLPLDDLDNGWLSIQESSPTNEKLQYFYDYFVDQWLENPVIPSTMWTCYNRPHRTNNAVEGWNNKLGHVVNKNHPRVLDLITHLKEEAAYSDFLCKRRELNLEGKRRKITYTYRVGQSDYEYFGRIPTY